MLERRRQCAAPELFAGALRHGPERGPAAFGLFTAAEGKSRRLGVRVRRGRRAVPYVALDEGTAEQQEDEPRQHQRKEKRCCLECIGMHVMTAETAHNPA